MSALLNFIARCWRHAFPEKVVLLHERFRKRGGITVRPRRGESEIPFHQNPRHHYYVAEWTGRPGVRFFVVGIEFNSGQAFLIEEKTMLEKPKKGDGGAKTMMDPVPLSEIRIIERIHRPSCRGAEPYEE